MYRDNAPDPMACPRCGGFVSADAGFCPECGLRRRGPEERRPRRARSWLPFAVIGVATAAIGLGIVLAVLVGGPDDRGLAATMPPGVSEAPTSSAEASAAGEPSVTPDPTMTATPVPTPEPNPTLANRSIADVVVDQLNVRAAGNGSAEVLGQLRAGARIFTIGAPETVDGMYWYRVAVVSGPYSGVGCQGYHEHCVEDIGWVASPMTDAPWLEQVAIGCPSSPMAAAELAQLKPLERLHCYGNQDIVVSGTIDHPCCGYVGPVLHTPAWLARPGSAPFFRDAGGILFRSDPARGLEPPERGDAIRATAHLDDSAASSCRQSIDPQYSDQQMEPGLIASTAEAVLICRSQLVVTRYEVVGHEDLGPCCGLEPGGQPPWGA